MSDNLDNLPVEVVPHVETAVAIRTAGALDMDPTEFREGINRRVANREYLFKQIGSMLKEREDFNVIKGKKCLSKAGSEKILGFLGLTATFPQLNRYEELAFSGVVPDNIILKCQVISGAGYVVAEGIGARSLAKDLNDLNKSLKMACKSAQIDATLRCVALSDIFTQDLDDMPEHTQKAQECSQENRGTTPAAGAATDPIPGHNQVAKQFATGDGLGRVKDMRKARAAATCDFCGQKHINKNDEIVIVEGIPGKSRVQAGPTECYDKWCKEASHAA
jgi:hypothetical protein